MSIYDSEVDHFTLGVLGYFDAEFRARLRAMGLDVRAEFRKAQRRYVQAVSMDPYEMFSTQGGRSVHWCHRDGKASLCGLTPQTPWIDPMTWDGECSKCSRSLRKIVRAAIADAGLSDAYSLG